MNSKMGFNFFGLNIKAALFFISCILSISAVAQTPKTYTSSELLLQLKKLNVLGSVLYIAAHPDDENTRLLAYMANEKLYRTGYLSLTRGDGGQNLIGDEQGIDLGLIRTQELLAARRIDGAEQFFSSAYDFGYCKTADEALATWGHDKVLSDVVWVIRKFKPDVIICRFPEDSRAGHGHHAASGILAREAFDAAADATKFPEQFKYGADVWQAKRLLWNTFNFGSANTQKEDQFKVEVGMYNPLLGRSYGEIAALSRSQHKSQGFGVPAQRGTVTEYFETVKGDKPVADLMEGVDISWNRIFSEKASSNRPAGDNAINRLLDSVIGAYSPEHPEKSLHHLVRLYNKVFTIENVYWKEQKLAEIKNLIEQCSGLFMEATSSSQYAVAGDSTKITYTANNRAGINISKINVLIANKYFVLDCSKKNTNATFTDVRLNDLKSTPTQPYWLQKPMNKGSFEISDQQLIGKPENNPVTAEFGVYIDSVYFTFNKPVRYKFTDPVKGEIYQPVTAVPPVTMNISPQLNVLYPDNLSGHQFNRELRFLSNNKSAPGICGTCEKQTTVPVEYDPKNWVTLLNAKPVEHTVKDAAGNNFLHFNEINYDHIPAIRYFTEAKERVLFTDVKTAGKLAGYISGAGDKVPQAMEQMGYKVVMLKETDLTHDNLKQFDVIVTGVRAYNINEWLSNGYDALMQYVKEGGVLLVQYNTNNSIGPVKAKMSPYPFTISRNRVTDENAAVKFLLPLHPALNYPNKITQKDFEGWIQERSTYHAEQPDSAYQRIISMKDPGETDQDGSLIIADYGKGRFVYTGLVFFRELPAGVAGAYRLFANLIANKR